MQHTSICSSPTATHFTHIRKGTLPQGVTADGEEGVAGAPREAHGSSDQGMVREVRRASAARRRWTPTKVPRSATDENSERLLSWQYKAARVAKQS